MDQMITSYFKDGLSTIVLDKDTNKVSFHYFLHNYVCMIMIHVIASLVDFSKSYFTSGIHVTSEHMILKSYDEVNVPTYLGPLGDHA